MVLIIDDEYALQEVMAEILGLSGISVVAADSGEEGIRLFSKYHDQIRMIFLDLHLPGMGGRATLRALREIDPHIDVVIMSGQPQVSAMAEFSGQKHLSYLEKPFTLDVLVASVTTVLTASECR